MLRWRALNCPTYYRPLFCAFSRVWKAKYTDMGNASQRGRLTLLRHLEYGTYKTVVIPAEIDAVEDMQLPAGWERAMEMVWENGTVERDWTFAEVRARSQLI